MIKITPEIKTDDLKCEVYKNKKLGCVFPHDFALNLPIEQTYDEVLTKYQRRINRFYNNIKQKQKVLLIWFSLDYSTSIEQIKEASDKLNKKFNKNVDLLIIEHCDELLNKNMQIDYINKNCTKISLFAKKLEETTGFTKGNTKVCGKIFKKYRLNIPMLKSAKITFIKLICKLIPIKSKRKQIRAKLLYKD